MKFLLTCCARPAWPCLCPLSVLLPCVIFCRSVPLLTRFSILRSDVGCVFGGFFLSSAFFVKGLWVFLWRCFGGPHRCPKGVLGAPLGSPYARPGFAQKGPPYHRDSFFFEVSLGSFGVLGGVSHAFFAFFWPFSLMARGGPTKLHRKSLLVSVARNLHVLQGFGRGPGVAGWPGGGPVGL